MKDNRKRVPYAFVATLVLLLFSALSCSDLPTFLEARTIRNGTFLMGSLKNPDLYRLVGEWKVRPASSDYTPGGSASERSAEKEVWYSIRVPGSWATVVREADLDQRNIFLYSLEIEAPMANFDPENPPSLFLPEVSNAYRMYVRYDRGEWIRVLQVGNAGSDLDSTRPEVLPKIVKLQPFKELSVRILVANFRTPDGGITSIPILGTESSVNRLVLERKTIDFFLSGTIFILGFYHLILFLMDTKKWSSLAFGLFSIIIAFRTPFAAHYMEGIFPGIFSYFWGIRISYLTFYAGVPLFYAYLNSHIKRSSSSVLDLIVYISGILGSLLVLVAPVQVFSLTLPYYQLYSVFLILWMGSLLINNYQTSRDFNSLALTIGFVILSLATINDILYYNFIIQTGNLSHHGLFLFTFIQVFIIARDNVKNKSYSDYLSDNLAVEVDRKKAELAKTLEALQERENQQKIELDIAYDIQKHILAELPAEYRGFATSGFLTYKEKVGGDYYDIFPVSDDRTGILMSDASGHGIPAALVTAMAKIAFTDTIYYGYNPSEILFKVNEKILKSLKKDNYLTALLAIVGPGPFITLSSASHQWPIFYRRSDRQAFELELSGGLFLGVFENHMQNFSDIQLPFEPGDRILMFTDGLPEQNNPENEIFGSDRLIELMHRTADMSLDDARNTIRWEWEVFQNGMPMRDDTALLIVEGRDHWNH